MDGTNEMACTDQSNFRSTGRYSGDSGGLWSKLRKSLRGSASITISFEHSVIIMVGYATIGALVAHHIAR